MAFRGSEKTGTTRTPARARCAATMLGALIAMTLILGPAPAAARDIGNCNKSEIRRQAFVYDVVTSYTRNHADAASEASSFFSVAWSHEATVLRVRRCRGLIAVRLSGGRSDIGSASYSGSASDEAEGTCAWSFGLAPIGALKLRGLLDKRKGLSKPQGLIGEVRNPFSEHASSFAREFRREMESGCLADHQAPADYYPAGSLGGSLGNAGSFSVFGPSLPALQLRLPIHGADASASHRRIGRRVRNSAIRHLLRGKAVALRSSDGMPSQPTAYTVAIELRPSAKRRRPTPKLAIGEAAAAARQEGCAFSERSEADCADADPEIATECDRQGRRQVTCSVSLEGEAPDVDGSLTRMSCHADVHVFKASDGRLTAAHPAWTCVVP